MAECSLRRIAQSKVRLSLLLSHHASLSERQEISDFPLTLWYSQLEGVAVQGGSWRFCSVETETANGVTASSALCTNSEQTKQRKHNLYRAFHKTLLQQSEIQMDEHGVCCDETT